MKPTYLEYHAPGSYPQGLAVSAVGILPQFNGSPTPVGYTPQQIQTAYGLNEVVFGAIKGNGAGQTIAIVDAYDDPSFVDSTDPSFSSSDLAQFDQTFGLPDPPSFTKYNQFGQTATDTLPGTDPAGAGNPNGNWEVEEALDVEWAHAIAPNASIDLVEANSAGTTDLFAAVITAAHLPGVSVVSMSWGSPENSGETSTDATFTAPGVTFVAATGDQGAPGYYPAYSPNVVAAGGTTLPLDAQGDYPGTGPNGEVAWSGSGGGISLYEAEPSYQESVQFTGQRTIPDVAWDANPSTGVAVYDSYNDTDGSGPWVDVGGTSVAAPSWSGLLAIVNQGRAIAGAATLNSNSGGSSNPTQTLTALYSLPSGDFHDIIHGSNGRFRAGPGYDEVTGLGTPVANLLIPDLVAYGSTGALQLVVTGQPPSSVTAGSPFGFTVAVENSQGAVESGFAGSVTIELASGAPGAVLGGTLTAAVSGGTASFSGLTLDTAFADYSIEATASGTSTATTNTFNVAPAPASQLVVTTQPPDSVTAGTAFGLVVMAEDPFGNMATSYTAVASVALESNPGGTSLGGTVTVPVSAGTARFSGLVLDKAASGYILDVTSGGLASATTSTVNVTPAAASQLVVTTEPPDSVTAGTPLGLVVTVEDRFENVATSYAGSVAIGLASNPGNTILGGILVVPASAGTATFSGLALDTAANGYTLQATSGGLTSATTSTFDVTPAAASQLTVTTQPPASVTAGAPFGLVVTAEDPFGNVASSYTGSVALTLESNPGSTSLGGIVAAAMNAGTATFSGLTLDAAASGYALQAASGELPSTTTNTFSVAPAAASQLVVTTQPPGSVTAGAPFVVAVTAEDPFGNVATSYTGTVAVALASNPGSSSLGGTVAVPASAGTATFSELTLDTAANGYTLSATSGGLTAATTNDLDVTPAGASQVVVTTQPPASVTAGATFGLVVTAEDPFGNVATSYTGSVTLALQSNPGSTSLGGMVPVPVSAGTARFSGLTLDTADNGYTLSATSGGLTAATTNKFDVTASSASQLVVTAQPASDVTAGAPFVVVVTAEDPFGNVATSYTGNVALALQSDPGNTHLGGMVPQTANGGSATFAGLTLDRADNGYTLDATSSALAPATTHSFDVTPAAASQLVVTTQPPASVAAGSPFVVIVEALDPFGNLATSYTGSVSVGLARNPGNTSLQGVVATPASAGTATFAGLALDGAANGYTLQLTSGGLTSATTNTIGVTPAAASQLTVTTEPPGSVTAGAGFGLVVTVEDAYGNVATSFAGTVNVALKSNPGETTLGGVLTATGSNGVVPLTGLTLDRAASGYTLVATSSGLASAVTTAFDVASATATHLVITTEPPASVPAGTSFGLTVAALDAFGNVAASFAGTVAIALKKSPGRSTLGGPRTESATIGVAVFSGLTLKERGNGYTLQATSAGLASTITTPIKVTPAPARQRVRKAKPAVRARSFVSSSPDSKEPGGIPRR